jgi:hypothetical protein
MRKVGYGLSYRSDDPYIECPRCGLRYRESEMKIEYTGKKVCERCCDDPPTALSKARRI